MRTTTDAGSRAVDAAVGSDVEAALDGAASPDAASTTAPDAGPFDAAVSDGGSTPADAAANPDAAPTFEPVTIDFDELPSQTELTTQYARWVTFSSEAGIPMTVESHINIDQSMPNYLSAGSFSDVHHAMYATFARPVRNLRFRALSVTSVGVVAHFRVFAGPTLLATVDLIGAGDSFRGVPVDLSAYSDVTRLEVVDITDQFGIVYDDFAFEVAR